MYVDFIEFLLYITDFLLPSTRRWMLTSLNSYCILQTFSYLQQGDVCWLHWILTVYYRLSPTFNKEMYSVCWLHWILIVYYRLSPTFNKEMYVDFIEFLLYITDFLVPSTRRCMLTSLNSYCILQTFSYLQQGDVCWLHWILIVYYRLSPTFNKEMYVDFIEFLLYITDFLLPSTRRCMLTSLNSYCILQTFSYLQQGDVCWLHWILIVYYRLSPTFNKEMYVDFIEFLLYITDFLLPSTRRWMLTSLNSYCILQTFSYLQQGDVCWLHWILIVYYRLSPTFNKEMYVDFIEFLLYITDFLLPSTRRCMLTSLNSYCILQTFSYLQQGDVCWLHWILIVYYRLSPTFNKEMYMYVDFIEFLLYITDFLLPSTRRCMLTSRNSYCILQTFSYLQQGDVCWLHWILTVYYRLSPTFNKEMYVDFIEFLLYITDFLLPSTRRCMLTSLNSYCILQTFSYLQQGDVYVLTSLNSYCILQTFSYLQQGDGCWLHWILIVYYRLSPTFNKEMYVDFIAAQIKTLSFLAYILRMYQVKSILGPQNFSIWSFICGWFDTFFNLCTSW